MPFEDPGMFALGDPKVLKDTYERAGFHDVTVQAMAGYRPFPSVALAVQDCRDSLPEVTALMVDLSDTERDAAWAEIEAIVRQFAGADEVRVPQAWLVCVGTK